MGMIVDSSRFGAGGGGGGVTDPLWDDVLLLLTSGDQLDHSPFARTMTYGANVTQSAGKTDIPGTTNAAGNGVITAPDSADWNVGDFTLELFGVEFDNTIDAQTLIAHYDIGTNNRSWAWQYHQGAANTAIITSSNGSGAATTAMGTFNPTGSHDIAIERHGSLVRAYADGVMLGSATITDVFFDSTAVLAIGAMLGVGGFSTTSNRFDGRFAAARITREARYASDAGYTVPSLPLPETPASPDAHRYWRVMFTRPRGGNRFDIRELQFLDAENTLLSTGGTPIFSIEDGTNTAAKAFNSNTADGWGTPVFNGLVQWLGYDFGAPVAVSKILITGGTTITFSPGDFHFQYSDDNVTWVTQGSVIDLSAWTSLQTRRFVLANYEPSTEYRNWRVTITGASSLAFAGFGEFRFLDGSDNPISLAGSSITATNRFDNNWDIAEAIDGNTASGNGWLTANGTQVGQYFVLCRPGNLAPVKLSAAPVNNFATAFPGQYTVEKTHDGITWTAVATVNTTTPTGSVYQNHTI